MKPNLLPVVLMSIALAGCGGTSTPEIDGHSAAESADYERGPHRGRLLRDGNFALEVTIFETGVPPEYRLYAYQDGKALPAKDVQATIDLSRLDGETNHFEFQAQGDLLVGNGIVTEPHSFAVVVTAQHGGQSYRWSFDSFEGQTTMPAAVAKAAGLRTELAGPATIHERIRLLGRVALNTDRFAEVRAQFEGPVREVRVKLGDSVRAGQTLAIVENRNSMRSFPVTAPFAGIVLARHTNVGDVAGAEPLFEIADLSSLWIDLDAFGDDITQLAPGQAIQVTASGDLRAEITLERLLPLANASSQTVTARAILPNPAGLWRPGMAVQGEITVAIHEVPLAVQRIGLQRFRDFTVVFAQVGETYEVRMLELGQQDATHVEVLGGLKSGTSYVTEQSFLIKADIEKSGASHDH